MNAFLTFDRGLLKMPPAVHVWLFLLLNVNLLAPFFLLEALEARVVLGTMLASGIQTCHNRRSDECQPAPRSCSANMTPGTGNQYPRMAAACTRVRGDTPTRAVTASASRRIAAQNPTVKSPNESNVSPPPVQ